MTFETLKETYMKNSSVSEHQLVFIWNAAIKEALSVAGMDSWDYINDLVQPTPEVKQ